MITKKELRDYAKITGLNLGEAEKDYFQNILLFIIYQFHDVGIIFKGGTALKKCYGLNRFSEDLDFTCIKKFNIQSLKKGMNRFRIDFEIKMKSYERSQKIMLKIKGPLYMGNPQSVCGIALDLSFREKIILPPKLKTIGRFLEELPAFDVIVMQEKEILAEKIRAMLSRNAARDLYDIWFLLNKDVELEPKLLNEKFKYYNRVWNLKDFESQINNLKHIWKSELSLLIKNVPDFNVVKNLVMCHAQKWKR